MEYSFVEGFVAENLLQISRGRQPVKLALQNEDQRQICLKSQELREEICKSSIFYHIYLSK